MNKTNYYAVTAKCGHVGKGKYIEVTFAIIASSGKEAAKKCKSMPRVKRDNSESIITVEKINFDDYTKLLNDNLKDPYLQCKNKQEQKLFCPELHQKIKNMCQSYDYSKNRAERLAYLFKKRKEIYDININNLYQLHSY